MVDGVAAIVRPDHVQAFAQGGASEGRLPSTQLYGCENRGRLPEGDLASGGFSGIRRDCGGEGGTANSTSRSRMATVFCPAPADEPVCATGSVGVLLGNGDGSFQATVRYSTLDAFAFTLTTGDFNGDGKPDLAVGNTNCEDLRGSCAGGSSVAILLGKGDGTIKVARHDSR